MVYFYVGMGGIGGSLFRFLVSRLTGTWTVGEYPVGTLLINLTGSFLLGWVSTRFVKPKKISPEIAGLITTGFIGAFTTFSTFSVEVVKLIGNGKWLFALSYIAMSMIGGLLIVRVGMSCGQFKGRNGNEVL